jgi:hypothetical protein
MLCGVVIILILLAAARTLAIVVIRISIQLRKEDVLFSGAVECDRVKKGNTQVCAGYKDVACLGSCTFGDSSQNYLGPDYLTSGAIRPRLSTR